MIGEISNKSEPSRKFVQTFVLAEQPNGYYVLNDIFRYLVDEEEIEDEQPPPGGEKPEFGGERPLEPEHSLAFPNTAVAKEAVKNVQGADNDGEKIAEGDNNKQVDTEAAAEKVDERLEDYEVNGAEKEQQQQQQQPPPTNGEGKTTTTTTKEEALKPEKPATPGPTPADKKAEKEADTPIPPAKSVPKTWANIASKSGAAAAAAAAAGATVPPVIPAAVPSSRAPIPPTVEANNEGSGWQTAGEGKKSRGEEGGGGGAQGQGQGQGQGQVLAYVKNVTDKVDPGELKQTLASFGKLRYFDVHRQKVSAMHIIIIIIIIIVWNLT